MIYVTCGDKCYLGTILGKHVFDWRVDKGKIARGLENLDLMRFNSEITKQVYRQQERHK